MVEFGAARSNVESERGERSQGSGLFGPISRMLADVLRRPSSHPGDGGYNPFAQILDYRFTQVGQGSENVVSPRARARVRSIQHTRRITSPVVRQQDVIWQVDPPKILMYKAKRLHRIGWIPFFPLRNIQATVLSSPFLHCQSLMLCLWALLVHLTALGADKDDIAAFIKFFSTSYLGAVFNAGMLVTFILGLFITLVIQRWWSIRTAYAKLSSTTVDLCTIIAKVLQPADPPPADPANPPDPTESMRGRSAVQQQVNRARTELIRFLNLGHLLVLTSTDAQSRHFAAYSLLEPLKAAAQKLGDCLGVCCRGYGGDEQFRKARSAAFPAYISSSRAAAEKGTFSKKARDINFLDLHLEGLVNRDEWKMILMNEQKGMARYLIVYEWTQALLLRCQREGLVRNAPQMMPMMLAKVSTIVECGSTIFTYINSQLPYPYVHLVSMVVHMYLFLLATYNGALMHNGFPEDSFAWRLSLTSWNPGQRLPTLSLSGDDLSDTARAAVEQTDGELSFAFTQSEGYQAQVEWFTVLWLYLIIGFANVVFQGMLDLHALLDNPFGGHCAKFPLRAHITEVMNATRSMLSSQDVAPAAFSDIFPGFEPPRGAQEMSDWMSERGGSTTADGRDASHRIGSAHNSFLRPGSTTAAEVFVTGSSALALDAAHARDSFSTVRSHPGSSTRHVQFWDGGGSSLPGDPPRSAQAPALASAAGGKPTTRRMSTKSWSSADICKEAQAGTSWRERRSESEDDIPVLELSLHSHARPGDAPDPPAAPRDSVPGAAARRSSGAAARRSSGAGSGAAHRRAG